MSNPYLEHPTPLINQEAQESYWKQPIPLATRLSTEAPYPLDALPNILQRVVHSYQRYGQQPLSLVANGALANLSLACQAHANVARDTYLTSPVSLYFLVIASSGERKSAADSIFSKAIRQWETAIRQKREPERLSALTQHKAWQMERDGLLTQIKRATYTGEDGEHYKELLEELVHPSVPATVRQK